MWFSLSTMDHIRRIIGQNQRPPCSLYTTPISLLRCAWQGVTYRGWYIGTPLWILHQLRKPISNLHIKNKKSSKTKNQILKSKIISNQNNSLCWKHMKTWNPFPGKTASSSEIARYALPTKIKILNLLSRKRIKYSSESPGGSKKLQGGCGFVSSLHAVPPTLHD